MSQTDFFLCTCEELKRTHTHIHPDTFATSETTIEYINVFIDNNNNDDYYAGRTVNDKLFDYLNV